MNVVDCVIVEEKVAVEKTTGLAFGVEDACKFIATAL